MTTQLTELTPGFDTIKECTYDGETFTYPDWVQAIAGFISMKDFFEKYKPHVPVMKDGLHMFCGGLCELEIFFGRYYQEGSLISDIISRNSLYDINSFVKKTRGKTNTEGRHMRSSSDSSQDTTDVTFRNDMVCLADLMFRYKKAKTDAGNPNGTIAQRVDSVVGG